MPEKLTYYEFRKLVTEHFSFLEKDYGYKVNKLNDWAYDLETTNTKVSLFVEHSVTLTVAIEPVGEAAANLLKQNILPTKIEVIVIGMCLDAQLHYKIERLSTGSIDSNIPVEMKKRASLLKTHCSKMLAGDFSDWEGIQKCMNKRALDFLRI